jgi:hypothetical protein
MKRYKSIFKESREDTVKAALDFADSSTSTNRKVFQFMLYLDDANFNKDEIIENAVELYKIQIGKAESLFKEVERINKSI